MFCSVSSTSSLKLDYSTPALVGADSHTAVVNDEVQFANQISRDSGEQLRVPEAPDEFD